MIKENDTWSFVCPICKMQGIPSVYWDEDNNQCICTNCSNTTRRAKGLIRDGSEHVGNKPQLFSLPELLILLIVGAILFSILYVLKGN